MSVAMAVAKLHFAYNGPLKWSQCSIPRGRTVESQILSELYLDVHLCFISHRLHPCRMKLQHLKEGMLGH